MQKEENKSTYKLRYVMSKINEYSLLILFFNILRKIYIIKILTNG